MLPELTPIARCAQIVGLGAHEMVLGVSPGEKHERLLATYRRAYAPAAARKRIVSDMRDALGSGAKMRAADLLIVLRRLLASESASDDRGPPARRRNRPMRLRLNWRVVADGPERRPAAGNGDGQASGQVLVWCGRPQEKF